MEKPFITFYTPTYRRPMALARCLESVHEQSVPEVIEQIVIPDVAGTGGDAGVARMFGQIRRYADAVHGEYVHILCDDDYLASADVVAEVKAFAEARGHPELIIVNAVKGRMYLPQKPAWPPVLGTIDLGCGIVRADVWKKHADKYGVSYEGDYVFYNALHEAGVQPAILELLFLIGGQSHGAAET